MRMLLLALVVLHGTLVSSTSIVISIKDATARSQIGNNRDAGKVIDNDVDTFYISTKDKGDKQPQWLKLTLNEESKVEKVVIIKR